MRTVHRIAQALPPWRGNILAVPAIGLAALTYFPITRNHFVGDDFLHLYQLVNESTLKFLLAFHGGHLQVTRNAVFLLCHEIFGVGVAGYFWLVLLTHLLNVFLLFRIIRDLTDSPSLAYFGSALWGILPVHQAGLGWYSVYGHALVATFTLFVLAGIVRVARGGPLHPLAPLLWVLVLFAAASSFGVGIGTACAMPIVALLLLPASARWRIVIPLGMGALVLPWLYIRLHALYAELYGMPDASVGLDLALEFWRSCARMLFSLISWGVVSTILGTLGDLVPFGKNSVHHQRPRRAVRERSPGCPAQRAGRVATSHHRQCGALHRCL